LSKGTESLIPENIREEIRKAALALAFSQDKDLIKQLETVKELKGEEKWNPSRRYRNEI